MQLHRRMTTGSVFMALTLLLALLLPWQISANAPQAPAVEEPQLFFPVAYQSFAGNTRNSIISIGNVNATPATVHVIFYTENGNATQLNSLNTVGGGSQPNPFVLQPGTGLSFLMSGQSLASGRYAVVVNSDQPLAGSSLVRVSVDNGATMSGMYNGFTSDVSTTAILPSVKKQQNGLGAELSIQNLSNAAANGAIAKFYNLAGQQVNQINLPSLPAYAAFQLNFIDSPQIPNGFEGSVVIDSPSPVAVVNNQLGDQNFGIPLRTSTSWSGGATTLQVPFLGNSTLGLGATLTVMNPGSQPANVTISHSNGSQPPAPFTLAAFASQTVNYPQSGFAATVTAGQPIVAVVTNTRLDSQGGASWHEAVGAGSLRFALPFFAKSYTGIPNSTLDSTLVLFNPGPGAASVIIGTPANFQNQQIPPNQFVTLNNLNFLPPNSVQSLAVVSAQGSTQPFHAMVYTANGIQGGDYLAAYTGIPVAEPLPPTVSMLKRTIGRAAVSAGGTITYSLAFRAGTEGGSAVITDDLPDQFTDYTYEVSDGLILTPTGAIDFVWDADVPASGGVITITGVFTGTENASIENTATIVADAGSASSSTGVILDVFPPTSEITEQPANPDNNATPTFSFTFTDAAPGGAINSGISNVECRVDGEDFSNCASPHTTASLADGEHTFEVRAIDGAGNVQPIPASYTWTIDTVAPAVPVLAAPSNSSVVTDTDVVTLIWEPVGDGDLAGYEVTLNGSVVDAGNVTQTVAGPLANGVYTWTVAAYDTAGNRSAPAGNRTFSVNRVLLIDPNETSEATFAGTGGVTTTITVPPGAVALSGTLAINFQVVPDTELPAPPSGGGLVTGFRMNLLQNGVVQPGVVFSTPITIEIAYDSALVSDPSTLQLFYLDENDEWSSDGITIVTPIGNPLIATLAHLTDFGLAESSRKLYLPTISN